MKSKPLILLLTAITAVGCTKTQRLTVGRFDPSSMQTSFVEEAPAKATYVVEIDRLGRKDDTRVETTRVVVLEGTTLGFSRRESAVVATAGDVRFDLPPLDTVSTLSWKGKRKVPTKLARAAATIGEAVVSGAIGVGELYVNSKLDELSDDERSQSDAPKRHHHH